MSGFNVKASIIGKDGKYTGLKIALIPNIFFQSRYPFPLLKTLGTFIDL